VGTPEKKYTKRTCHGCGVKLPQPEMNRMEIEVKSGTSQRGLLLRNVAGLAVGAAFGMTQGKTAVLNWAFGNHRRNYTRMRTIWACNDCIALASD